VVKSSKNAPNQVHLLFFNEAATAKLVKFKVEVTNKADNRSFSKEINFSAAAFQMVHTDCSSDNPLFATFKINMPDD